MRSMTRRAGVLLGAGLALFASGCAHDHPAAAPTRDVAGLEARVERTSQGLRTWQLVFAPHTDPVAVLSEFLLANHVQYASYYGIGACESATFAAFDPAIKGYTPMAHAEQMEILTFTGESSWMDGKPLLHTHATFGKLDGAALGGHVLAVKVYPTLELVLTEGSSPIARGPDPSGAKLMKLDQPVQR